MPIYSGDKDMWQWRNNNTELYHYGILGMKWGVRRFQNPDGTLTRAGKRRYTEPGKNNTHVNAEPEINSKKGLSDKQKRALKIGATVAVAALAAYGGYKLYQSGKLDSLISAGKHKVTGILGNAAEKGTVSTISDFRTLSHKESIEEAISKANPTKNYKNCYNCVTATTLRMCGIDAVAKGDTQGGKGRAFEDICKIFKVKEKDILHVNSPDVDRVQRNILRKFKEGDVGAIGFSWNNPVLGDAHTLNWTIRNGQVEFMDGQVGKGNNFLRSYLSKYMDNNHEAEIAKFANAIKGLDLDKDVDANLLREFV